MIRRVLVAALLVASLAVAGAGDAKPEPPPSLADQFVAAFRSGDEREMSAITAKSQEAIHLDPFFVTHDLFGRHLQAVLAVPPQADDLLDAARAFAERAASLKRFAALPGVVDTWSKLTADEVRRESDLFRTLAETSAAVWSRNTHAVDRDAVARLRAAAEGATKFGAARALWHAATTIEHAGPTKEVVDAWRACAVAADRASWPSGRCAALRVGARLAYRSGDIATARSMWQEVVDVLDAQGDTVEEASVLLCLVDVEEVLGRYGEALRLCERVRVLAAGADPHAEGEAITEAANIHALRGEAASALSMFDAMRQRWLHVNPDQVRAAWALSLIGRTYAGLGLDDRAVAAYEQAIAEVLPVSVDHREFNRDIARYRSELGQVFADMGRLDRAAELQEQAWRALDAAGDRIDADDAMARLGEVLMRRGLHARAVDVQGGALADMEKMGIRGSVARVRAGLGRARAAAGDARGAMEDSAKALAELDALGDRVEAARVLRDLAELHRAAGRPEQALSFARRAVETPLAIGIGLGEAERAGLARDARAAADAGMLAAHEFAARDPGNAAAACADAFWFAEASRGLLLAEAVVNRDTLLAAAVAPDLNDADAAARGRVAALRNGLAELASHPDVDAKLLAGLRADLDAAYRGLEETTSRVQRDARRVADLVYPHPVSLADVQASLDDGTALLVYHLTTERTFAVVVTRGAARLVDLGDSSEIAAAAQAFVDVVSVAGSDDSRKAAALYDRLLRPVESETTGKRRLLIVPDGPLAFVPFEATLRADGSRRERAIERWEFEYAPSATVFCVLARERAAVGAPGDGVVAVGDPVYEDESTSASAELRRFGRLRRLPGTADEVRAITELVPADRRTVLLRQDATVARLADALARAPRRLAVLHLACHGRIDAERPRLTGLVLSGGDVLTVDDVCRMRTPADLVVLSACETGRGRIVRGEGVMNLARAFLFAGASRVVVSNWAVADEAARELMVAFHRGLLRDGHPPGEALRAAKLAMLRAGGAFAHPAHWAAFVLWGD